MLDRRSGGQCGPPIGHHPINVFGMYCVLPPPTHPLFLGELRVVQPALAYEIDRSIRQSGHHIDGDRLNESPKLSLTEADFLFSPLCLSDIDDCPRKLGVIGRGPKRSRQNTNILDAIVGKEQTILAINGATSRRSSFYKLKQQITVLGVNTFHDHARRGLLRRIVFEDAIGFIRPDILTAAWPPTETACVTQLLGFGQIGFATPELLRQQLVLCNIDAYANSLQTACFRGCRPNTTDVSELAVRTYDAFRDVNPARFHRHLIYERSHELTIFGVDER